MLHQRQHMEHQRTSQPVVVEQQEGIKIEVEMSSQDDVNESQVN